MSNKELKMVLNNRTKKIEPIQRRVQWFKIYRIKLVKARDGSE